MTALRRQAESELMDIPSEVAAYAQADFRDVNQRFVERLLELAAGMEHARALDFGTGPGDIPIRAAQARPQWHISALDASAPMLDVAREAIDRAGLAARIELVLADAKGSVLSAESFDVVFSNSILHHVSDPLALWREIKRVAKPGALIFIRDLFRPETESAARQIVAQHAGTESALLQEEFYQSLLAAYTADEVRGQLAQVGMSDLYVSIVSDRHMDVWGKREEII